MPMRALPSVDWAETLDAQLAQPSHVQALQPEMSRWSRTVRGALGLAAVDLAKRLGISQPAVTKLEANEASGSISIERLGAIANALDCDFVYGFIPRRPLAHTALANQRRQDSAREAHRKLPRLA